MRLALLEELRHRKMRLREHRQEPLARSAGGGRHPFVGRDRQADRSPTRTQPMISAGCWPAISEAPIAHHGSCRPEVVLGVAVASPSRARPTAQRRCRRGRPAIDIQTRQLHPSSGDRAARAGAGGEAAPRAVRGWSRQRARPPRRRGDGGRRAASAFHLLSSRPLVSCTNLSTKNTDSTCCDGVDAVGEGQAEAGEQHREGQVRKFAVHCARPAARPEPRIWLGNISPTSPHPGPQDMLKNTT